MAQISLQQGDACSHLDHRTKTRILIVDDSSIDREFMKRALENEGYLVTTASDGDDAMTLLRSGIPIKMLLTDIQMPGMNGIELAKLIFEVSPDIHILFISGFKQRFPTELSGRRIDFVEKSADGKNLVRKVAEVLKAKIPAVDFYSEANRI